MCIIGSLIKQIIEKDLAYLFFSRRCIHTVFNFTKHSFLAMSMLAYWPPG